MYCTAIYTHGHMHANTKAKAKSLAMPSGHANPVNQHWDAWALLRHYKQVLANPPGGGAPQSTHTHTHTHTLSLGLPSQVVLEL